MTTDPADLNGDRANVESETARNALSHADEETIHQMAPKTGWVLPTGLLIATCLFFFLGFLAAGAVVGATLATVLFAKVTRAGERPVAVLFGLLVISAIVGAVLIQEAALDAQRRADEAMFDDQMGSFYDGVEESLFSELGDAGAPTVPPTEAP